VQFQRKSLPSSLSLTHCGELADGKTLPDIQCLLHCMCITFLPSACGMRMRQRREIRKKYNLTGNCCGDCLRICCCSCCELMQADNEVRAKKERTAPAPSEAGYRRPDGMTYGP